MFLLFKYIDFFIMVGPHSIFVYPYNGLMNEKLCRVYKKIIYNDLNIGVFVWLSVGYHVIVLVYPS